PLIAVGSRPDQKQFIDGSRNLDSLSDDKHSGALPPRDEFCKMTRHCPVIVGHKHAPFVCRLLQDVEIRDSLQACIESSLYVDRGFPAEETINDFSIEIVIRQKTDLHRGVVRRSSLARISRSYSSGFSL